MTESSKNKVFVVVIMIFLAVCLLLYSAREILAPFLVAAFITYLISPLVVKIQSYGYRRWVGVTIIATVLVASTVVILIIFIPLLISEIEKFKISYFDYYKSFSNYADVVRNKIETAAPIIKRYDVSDIVIVKIRDFMLLKAQQIPAYLMNIFSIFSIIILIPMLVFFMLLGGNKGINATVAFFPSYYIETILSIMYEMDSVLGRFIRGQLIEASFVGVVSAIFFSALGINFALIIGIIAGIANMIPYFGHYVGLVIALIVGVIQYQTFAIAFKIIVAYATIRFLDNNFVQPLAIGHNVNLGSVAMIFAMLAGAQIFGFLGVIFAIPVMAILKTIFIMLVQKYKKATA
ncbi:MAG: AI-2E family transporter [Endomicrobium sp.]|uniref:AI-2E family transporter n=1 Tax=Candidatus Endomicrobiellum pyrsonymphae TaxID=1408203 RepID=UPI0035826D30|nr:AI-2E family transporter [Endomicrobium sp.]